MPKSKIWEWYQLIAINGFNTILFVVIVIFILDLGLDLRRFARGERPTYSLEFDLESYTLVDREKARQVGAEHDRMGENQTFLFHPWTVSTVAPFGGAEVNVERGKTANFRHTPTPPPDDRPPYRVWAFGGSTTFGWGMPDSHTLATQLQTELQARMPKARIEVTNYAQPYYFSSVELSAFLGLLRVERKPDAVVFIDGHNDVQWIGLGVEVPVFTFRAHMAWERIRRQFTFESDWFTINPSFPLMRIRNFLRFVGLVQVSDYEDMWQFYRERSDNPVERVTSVYRANREIIGAIADRYGIQAWFFLQPVHWYGPRAPADGKGPYYLSASIAQPTYDALIAEARSGRSRGFHSLHDALDGVEKSYVDHAHYSDAGNLALARTMAEIMANERR